ncbi:MAG TPA: hypothetical protein VJV78_37050 [Polyangiales bacterium]|nr:hypothetical protein [Polyangiales bacterium]
MRAAVAALAQRSGLSRFAIGRWLSGQCQPRLPDFFRLVDHPRVVFSEICSIGAASEPADEIGLFNLQLVRWE